MKKENKSNKMPMAKWLTIEGYVAFHVVPQTDSRPHGIRKKETDTQIELADLNCPCNPKIDMRGRKPIIIHNSFETEDFLNSLIPHDNGEKK